MQGQAEETNTIFVKYSNNILYTPKLKKGQGQVYKLCYIINKWNQPSERSQGN